MILCCLFQTTAGFYFGDKMGTSPCQNRPKLSVYVCFRLVCPDYVNLLSSKVLEAKRMPRAGLEPATQWLRAIRCAFMGYTSVLDEFA